MTAWSAVQALSDATAALSASDFKFVQINDRISTYSDTVAACERLYKQPIPTAYTRHACHCSDQFSQALNPEHTLRGNGAALIRCLSEFMLLLQRACWRDQDCRSDGC